jgi:hypothetical protein
MKTNKENSFNEWTKEFALILGEDLIQWLKSADENIFLEDFLYLSCNNSKYPGKISSDLLSFLIKKYKEFSELFILAKNIEDAKLKKFGSFDKLNASLVKDILKPKIKEGDKRIGNQFWKLRSKHGRDKLFKTPELLWKSACEYFQWCENNPLMETKAFAYQGIVVTKELPKMRAMTLSQLCFYLHCDESYFRYFKSTIKPEDKDFLTVIHNIEAVIYNQKFQGAAADLLNANIIARELGLADKSELTGKGGKDLIPSSSLTDEQLNQRIEALKQELNV